MVEFKTKLTGSGVFYIPKEIREAFGREMVLIPNSCAVVMFRQGLAYKHVLASMKIIAADINHRIEIEREKNLQSDPVSAGRSGEPPTVKRDVGGN